MLRRVIFDVVKDDEATSLAEQGGLVADLIEAAVADAVRSYVDARDFAARKAEAEHVGFVTHELRNPLTAAMQATTRLEQQPDVVARMGSVLGVLRNSLGRLHMLIDRVLETQRMTLPKA